LSAAGRAIPFLEDFVSEQIAEEFQPKLLQYRLTKFSTARTPEIDVSELTAPMQDLARALATCVADDERAATWRRSSPAGARRGCSR
jgi:hypothetical protein